MKNKIFITGANGFVGKALIKELSFHNHEYVAGTRELYGDLSSYTGWDNLLSDIEVVVHLAARVHVMNEKSNNPLEEFRKVNVQGSLALAKASKKAGVKRFIYLSSVKVNGEETFDLPFTADDTPCPLDAYGISKAEAEIELLKLHEPNIFEVVVIRPPLVYGPGVKANFEKLFLLVNKGLPIPFGSVANKRSLVSVYNLSDLIIKCFDHRSAGGKIFLVTDDRDYSLKDIITLMGKVVGKRPNLLAINVGLMKFAALVLGKKSYATRLFGNLHLDIRKTKSLLDWKPPYSFEETYKKN